jgi:hypothetical protein
MQKVSAERLGTRIRFLCTSHSVAIPTVTMHENQWAFCPGGYIAAQTGHFWTAIEPANVDTVPTQVPAVPRRRLAG